VRPPYVPAVRIRRALPLSPPGDLLAVQRAHRACPANHAERF